VSTLKVNYLLIISFLKTLIKEACELRFPERYWALNLSRAHFFGRGVELIEPREEGLECSD